jgi:hypothetical protein
MMDTAKHLASARRQRPARAPDTFFGALLMAIATSCGEVGPDPGGVGGGGIPASATELGAFLRAGSYKSWAAEPAVHAATGNSPHGSVRVFHNQALADSLTAGATAHPQGAASVKELYDSDGQTLAGFSVMIKVAESSGSGEGWYWYETFDANADSPFVSATGAKGCTGCHSGAPTDFVFTPFPFKP